MSKWIMGRWVDGRGELVDWWVGDRWVSKCTYDGWMER